MSKFIKVTDIDAGIEMLIPASSITSISNFCTKVSRIVCVDNSFNVKESIEQIEAQLLRDEFAMAAMQSLINTFHPETVDYDHIPEESYKMADLMIEARNENNKKNS